MIQIYAANDHFSFITNHIDAQQHAHTMIQITIAFNESFEVSIQSNTIKCKGIMIDSNISHIFKGEEQTQLFFLIDPTSRLGECLKQYYLYVDTYIILPDKLISDIIDKLKSVSLPFITQEEYSYFFDFFLEKLQIENDTKKETNEVVKKVLYEIHSSDSSIPSIEKLSKDVFLSQSRLSHLFKENTGLALYSYILMQKVKKTIALIFQGTSITEASMQIGFDSPSHFASVCKRMLGMSTRALSKDSVFLKVSSYEE